MMSVAAILMMVMIAWLATRMLSSSGTNKYIKPTYKHVDLLLLSFLGFFIICTILLVHYYPNGNPVSLSPDVEELKDLVAERLPDQSTQNRRHQETLEAIKRIEANINTSAEPDGLSITIFGIVFIATFVLLSIWFIFKTIGQPSKAIGILAIFAVFISGLTIIDKIFSFSVIENMSFTLFSVPSDKVNRVDTMEQKINISIETPDRMSVTCPDQYKIGPFATGMTDKLGNSATLADKIQSLVKSLSSDSASDMPQWLVLIGSADRRPLTSDLARRYGSNAGLAQARALHVKTLLEQKLGARVPAMFAFSTGPSVTITTPKDTEERVLAGDRSVYICGVFSDI